MTAPAARPRQTFTLPGGVKVRCQSNRRYFVARVYAGEAVILRRSDDRQTAIDYADRHDHQHAYVVDTATGRVRVGRNEWVDG